MGVGLEYGFCPNWSVGVEYDHIFIGNELANFTTPPARLPVPTAIHGDADS